MSCDCDTPTVCCDNLDRLHDRYWENQFLIGIHSMEPIDQIHHENAVYIRDNYDQDDVEDDPE